MLNSFINKSRILIIIIILFYCKKNSDNISSPQSQNINKENKTNNENPQNNLKEEAGENVKKNKILKKNTFKSQNDLIFILIPGLQILDKEIDYMEPLNKELSKSYPKANILSFSYESSFKVQAKKIILEIKKIKNSKNKKNIFIGHSLGGNYSIGMLEIFEKKNYKDIEAISIGGAIEGAESLRNMERKLDILKNEKVLKHFIKKYYDSTNIEDSSKKANDLLNFIFLFLKNYIKKLNQEEIDFLKPESSFIKGICKYLKTTKKNIYLIGSTIDFFEIFSKTLEVFNGFKPIPDQIKNEYRSIINNKYEQIVMNKVEPHDSIFGISTQLATNVIKKNNRIKNEEFSNIEIKEFSNIKHIEQPTNNKIIKEILDYLKNKINK